MKHIQKPVQPLEVGDLGDIADDYSDEAAPWWQRAFWLAEKAWSSVTGRLVVAAGLVWVIYAAVAP